MEIESKMKLDTITFIKLPVHVCDTVNDYYLFDILLPSKCSETVTLSILNLLCKIRSVLINQKNVDRILSTFLDSQSYSTLNHIFMVDVIETNRDSDGLKKIKIGSKTFSLNNQENSDFYFHSMICMHIMSIYNFD